MTVNNNCNYELWIGGLGALVFFSGVGLTVVGFLGHNWKLILGGAAMTGVGGVALVLLGAVTSSKPKKIPKPQKQNPAAAFCQKATVRDRGWIQNHISGKNIPTNNIYTRAVDEHRTVTMNGKFVPNRRSAVDDGRSNEMQNREL